MILTMTLLIAALKRFGPKVYPFKNKKIAARAASVAMAGIPTHQAVRYEYPEMARRLQETKGAH